MNDQEQATISFMKRYGGSFVQALAEAYICADMQNRARIRSAFADYWDRYSAMAAADPAIHERYTT
jgi:hypothetical protein